MWPTLAKSSVRVGNKGRERGTVSVLSIVEAYGRDRLLRFFQVHEMLTIGRDVVHDENAGGVVHDLVVVYVQTTGGQPGSHSEEEFRLQQVHGSRIVRHSV